MKSSPAVETDERPVAPTEAGRAVDPATSLPARLPDTRADRAAEVRFLLAAAVATGFSILLWAILVGTASGQNLENLALQGVVLRSDPERNAALTRLAPITMAVVALLVIAVFVAGLVRRRGGLGSTAAGVMLVSVVAAELLKEVLPRPALQEGPAWILRNSFPSGTAAIGTSAAVAALLVAPERLRWLILPLGATAAAAVADAIQVAGWHRLSDTVGASLLVVAVGAIGLAMLARAGLVHPTTRGRVDRRIRNGILLVALLLSGVGLLLLALPTVFPILTAPDGTRRAFLQTAFPLLGASATVVAIVAFAMLVEPYSLGRGEPARRAARVVPAGLPTDDVSPGSLPPSDRR